MLVSDRGIDLSVQAQRHFLLMVSPSVSVCVFSVMHCLATWLNWPWCKWHCMSFIFGKKIQAKVFIENHPMDHWRCLQTVYNPVNLLISVGKHEFIDFLRMVTSLISLHICPYMSFNLPSYLLYLYKSHPYFPFLSSTDCNQGGRHQ